MSRLPEFTELQELERQRLEEKATQDARVLGLRGAGFNEFRDYGHRMGLDVLPLGFAISGLGFRVYGLAPGFFGLGFEVHGLRFGIEAGIHAHPDRQSSPF